MESNVSATDEKKSSVPEWTTLPCKERTLRFIDETRAFFTLNNRSVFWSGEDDPTPEEYCTYTPSGNSQGCAIGRFVPDVHRLGGVSLVVNTPYVFDRLPQWMRQLHPEHLRMVQRLHDSAGNWTEAGLSTLGALCCDNSKREVERFYSRNDVDPSLKYQIPSRTIRGVNDIYTDQHMAIAVADPNQTTFNSLLGLIDHFKDKNVRPTGCWVWHTRMEQSSGYYTRVDIDWDSLLPQLGKLEK